MPSDPWTDSDPGRGDFDAELASIDPRYVETHGGDPDVRLRILVSVEGDDAERASRADRRRARPEPGDVVAELRRDAGRSVA